MKEMKNMKYWKYKNNIPGINNDFEKGNNLPDGRSKSSPFQSEEVKKVKQEKKTVPTYKDLGLKPTKTKITTDPPVKPVKEESTAAPKSIGGIIAGKLSGGTAKKSMDEIID